MFITASKIFDLPIASLESKSKIGFVGNLIFNPDDLTLIALEVITGKFIFQKKLFLSAIDIIDFDKNAIVIRNEESLVKPQEIVRIDKIIKDKTPIFGQKAVTKSHQNLGKIFDLLIDTETSAIIKFYVSNLFQERIFPSDKVEKITAKAVVFYDEVIEQIPIVEVEGAAA